MAEITVNIRGRSYPIACEDGQEEHIVKLAGYVDQRAQELVDQIGQVGPQQLVVMVSLLVADELSEAYERIRELKDEAKDQAARAREDVVREFDAELRKLRSEMADAEARARQAGESEIESKLAPRLAQMAERIESLAARLESD